MQIDIIDQTNSLETSQVNLLKEILIHAGEVEKIVTNVEISITIVNNEAIQSLNAEYRNKNEATDVLSFQMDNPFREIENDSDVPVMLGDIIISIEKVKEQAKRYNHSFEREIAFLTVHGFLHLLGYTHDNVTEEKVMFQKQDAVLEEFNLER